MRTPRLTLGWLMLGVGVAALDSALVFSPRPVLGLDFCLDTGLIPTVPPLAAALFAVMSGARRPRPFLVAFLVSGSLILLTYVLAARSRPDVFAPVILRYVNEIEPRFMDPDTPPTWALSLFVRGLIVGLPQVLVAGFVGLIAHVWAGRARALAAS